LFAKRLGENGGRLLPFGPPLPTTYDQAFCDRAALLAQLTNQHVVRSFTSPGETLFIGIYNWEYKQVVPSWLVDAKRSQYVRGAQAFAAHPKFSSGAKSGSERTNVRVMINVFLCDPRPYYRGSGTGTASNIVQQLDGLSPESVNETDELAASNSAPHPLPLCPLPPDPAWDTNVTFLVLPLLLGIVTSLGMVICATVWSRIFRYHLLRAVYGGDVQLDVHLHSMAGNPDISSRELQRDFLTIDEIRSMFPTFVFTKKQAVALGTSGDPSCSVCLSSYEEGERLRRLGCGHTYHADGCLDQWLQTSATCPRCRKSARIADVSHTALTAVRGALRHTVAGLGRVATGISRLLPGGSGAARSRNGSDGAVVGGGGSLGPGMRRTSPRGVYAPVSIGADGEVGEL
jgi:hypothetical protein